MATGRRCLVAGCRCGGYMMEMKAYDETEEFLETDSPELGHDCLRCGHPEEQHELAAAN